MKRHGHLFEQLVSWPNLLRAAWQAARGKRHRDNVLQFQFDYELELLRLQRELTDRTYRPGPYRTFRIVVPKPRTISAAPFRDRVVHHALVNVLEPIFERRFIDDSYACRAGKGTHAALDRFQSFCRRHRYVLQCDIQKFFPSIDHEILMQRISRVIKDPSVLWLCRLIVDHSNPQEPVDGYFPGDDLFTVCERRHGLPIGNQTSQFFANAYLDPLDHFVKESLGCRAYVRYVDDFLLCADDSRKLADWREGIRAFLMGLRLRLHRTKCQVFPSTQGTQFLGFRLFPAHRRLCKEGVRRTRKWLRTMQRDFCLGLLKPEKLSSRILAWLGHARHGQTWQLTARLFREYRFSGSVGI